MGRASCRGSFRFRACAAPVEDAAAAIAFAQVAYNGCLFEEAAEHAAHDKMRNKRIMIDHQKAQQAVAMLLEAIGEDPSREGLLETPARVARMYEEVCGGYDENAAEHLGTTFHVDGSEMVLERDIRFYSLCEHHLLPFFGVAHVAYIPNGEVTGLSKLARTVEVFARRLQLQERLTAQIADALMDDLHAKGAIVMIQAEHMCMSMRGVRKPGSQTATLAKRGVFESDPRLADDFFRMLG